MDMPKAKLGIKTYQVDRGFSLIEALVASFLLMLAVSQSMTLFGNSMDAMSKSRLRDSVNHTINADLEEIRGEVTNWKRSEINGITSYEALTPDICTGKLATTALTDLWADNLIPATNSSVDLGNNVSLKGLTITRTIGAYSGGEGWAGNLILVAYKSQTGGILNINKRSILSIPAQAWCNYDQS